jgi:hypothetical protein
VGASPAYLYGVHSRSENACKNPTRQYMPWPVPLQKHPQWYVPGRGMDVPLAVKLVCLRLDFPKTLPP